MLETLCNVIIRRTEYMEKFERKTHFTKSARKLIYFTHYELTVVDQSAVPTAQFHQGSPISEVKIVLVMAYPCTGYRVKKTNNATFKIMAGPTETSVIFIEPKIYNGKIRLIPAELVENVTAFYLFHIEKYF